MHENSFAKIQREKTHANFVRRISAKKKRTQISSAEFQRKKMHEKFCRKNSA
jgi:hypothetical protein